MSNENQAAGFKIHYHSFLYFPVFVSRWLMLSFKGKLGLFARAFSSPPVNLRNSRNGIEEKRAKRGGSYVNFEDKVGAQQAIRAFGTSLWHDENNFSVWGYMPQDD